MTRPAIRRHGRKMLLGSCLLAMSCGLAGLPWWLMLAVIFGFHITTTVPAEVIKEMNEARRND